MELQKGSKMNDLISRQDAVNAISKLSAWHNIEGAWVYQVEALDTLRYMPSAEPEIKPISYADCANAMMMMWIEEVITDGEYNRIMDRLNERKTDGRFN